MQLFPTQTTEYQASEAGNGRNSLSLWLDLEKGRICKPELQKATTMKTTKAFALLCLVLLHAPPIRSQPRPRVIFNIVESQNLNFCHWDHAEIQTVDTSALKIVYDLQYRRKSDSDASSRQLTVVQIGSEKLKYYSMITQYWDHVYHTIARLLPAHPVPGQMISYTPTERDRWIREHAGADYINSEIWIDRTQRMLTERMHHYTIKNESIEYDEQRPDFEWRLLDGCDTICGYACLTAETAFRGRKWSVWYAPELPFDGGPWKFGGLPGVILRVRDADGDFCWECCELTCDREPMLYYKVHSTRIDRKKWHRYRQRVHEAPLDILSEGGRVQYRLQMKPITPDSRWTIPYDPIELE